MEKFSQTDNHTTASYENTSLVATAICHVVYTE